MSVSWLKILAQIPPEWIQLVFTTGRTLFIRPQGMYEVLAYEAELELLDPQGKKAIYRKYQKVRFLQDNIIAYQDQAWGDGDIFADYKCSPGKPVDRYAEGNIYRILISLRETKNRGDEEEFYIERTIKNGFTKPRQYFQNRINHRMKHFSTSIIFPATVQPKELCLVTHHQARTMLLNASHTRFLPDGRYKITWSTSHPRQHELYSIRWEW